MRYRQCDDVSLISIRVELFNFHFFRVFTYFRFNSCLLNQEAEALAASEVAFRLQAGQHGGLQVTIAPEPGAITGPSVNPHPEPV